MKAANSVRTEARFSVAPDKCSAYRKARRDAASETTLDEDAFPSSVLWSYEQVLDDNFWPGAENDGH